MKPDFPLSQIALLLRRTAFNAQPGTPDLALNVLRQLSSMPGLADLVRGSLEVLQAAREPVASAGSAPSDVPWHRRNGLKWGPALSS